MTFNITETGKFVQKVVFQLEKDYKMALHPTAEKSRSQSLRVSLMWLFYFLTSNIGIFFFWEFSVRLSFLDTTVAAQMCNVTIHFHHGPVRPRQARSRVRWKLDLWLSNQHSNCGLAFCFLALTSLESIYPFLPVRDTHPAFIPPLELKEIPLHTWFPQL